MTTSSPHSHLWNLDESMLYLNHGSFGAATVATRERKQAIQDQIESQPGRFFLRELFGLMVEAREAIGSLVGAAAKDIALMPNATAAVNTVLRSLTFEPGDEIIVTSHGYNACNNAAYFVAERWGATVVNVDIPFPIEGPHVVTERVLAAVSPKTRLALIDHITSPTALIYPVATLVQELEAKDIPVLIDGAHAPGMLSLNLERLGASYYTGNCHKWLCTPKGSAFLHVREDRQPPIRPLSISHGASDPTEKQSMFRNEFDWLGTHDPSAVLSVPVGIKTLASCFDNGIDGVMAHNHTLVMEMREKFCQALEIEPPCPRSMIGSIASLPINLDALSSPEGTDPIQNLLFEKYNIEAYIAAPPRNPTRALRLSAQLYKHPSQFETFLEALLEIQRDHDMTLRRA